MRGYRDKSWIDPRIEVRESPVGGTGMFARAAIQAGEVVIIWGGTLMTKEEIGAGKARPHSIAPVDEDLYLAGLAGDEPSPDDFMNHSCDPNVWLNDEVTLVARRDIAAGEELTADYAMWEADDDWTMAPKCRCGSKGCRRVITGRDWRRTDLQEQYGEHFSPFINRRIANLKR